MPNFKQYTPLVLMLLIYAAVFFTQTAIIQNIWYYSFDDGTYSHAFLIPIIIAYLYIILFNENLLIINKKMNYTFVVITLVSACFLFIFSSVKIPFGFRLILPLFMTCIIGIIFKPTFKVLFPSLFLVFLLPIWGVLTPYLQQLSTLTVSYIMGLSGIPIYVEDNFISIPSGVFEIAGGCSGLRYLIVSLSISCLFIFLNIRKYSYALIFIFIAILGALLTNWIRITALIVIGHFTNMESELMQNHNNFGWYLYIPFMISLFYFGQKFVDTPPKTTQTQTQTKIENSLWTPSILISMIILFIFSQENRIKITSQPIKVPNKCKKILNDLPLPILYNLSYSCMTKKDDEIEITYFYDGSNLEGSMHFYMNAFTPLNWKVEYNGEANNWQKLTAYKENLGYEIKYQFKIGTRSTTNEKHLKQLRLSEMVQGNNHSALTWKIKEID